MNFVNNISEKNTYKYIICPWPGGYNNKIQYGRVDITTKSKPPPTRSPAKPDPLPFLKIPTDSFLFYYLLLVTYTIDMSHLMTIFFSYVPPNVQSIPKSYPVIRSWLHLKIISSGLFYIKLLILW